MDEKPIADRQSAERVEGCWLLLEYPSNPTIRLDARLLDRALAYDSNLVLSVGELNMGLHITGGPHVAREIADALARFRRNAPITCLEVLEDARRRRAALNDKNVSRPVALFIGEAPVHVVSQRIHFGELSVSIDRVAALSAQKTSLRVPRGGGRIQAAIPLLLVADQLRDEDVMELDRRIAEYEASNKAVDPTKGKTP